MCLAIAAKAGKRVPETHLAAGWRGNRDGAGFAYLRDGQVIVNKGHMTLDSLLSAYDADFINHQNSPFLIHFRTSTGGTLSKENTHPFSGKYGAFIHNGVFYGMGNSVKSDTAEFADIIADITEEQLPKVLAKVEKHVGWSKCVFLTPSGALHFIDERSGYWDGDIWYSNLGYKSGVRDYGGMGNTNGSAGSHCGIGA